MGLDRLLAVVRIDFLGETPMFGRHLRVLFGGGWLGGGHLERRFLLLEHRYRLFSFDDLHVNLGDLLEQFILGGAQLV